MAAIPPTFTVREALTLCGVDNETIYNGETQAQRLATNIFSDDFLVCIDKSSTSLKDDLDFYSNLTANSGRIRLLPGTKNNLLGFIQWVRGEIRMGRDPASTPFPVHTVPILLRNYHSHRRFEDQAEMRSKAARPKTFTTETKWEDWATTFRGYLRQIPGRNGVPLSYVIRNPYEADATPAPTGDFIEDYVNHCPLTGEAYNQDNSSVAVYLLSYISECVDAEAIVQSVTDQNDGRGMFRALHQHYAGSGIYANETRRAEEIIKNLFYSGEKPPHMYWDKFKRELLWAYATIDKVERRVVYSNEQKLRQLTQKLKADFLAPQLSSIVIELAKVPMIYTFDNAISAVTMTVQARHPPGSQTRYDSARRRQIRQTDSRRGRGGNNRGGNGRGGRGNNREYIGTKTFPSRDRVTSTRDGSQPQKLANGKWIEYHASIKYSNDIMSSMPSQLKDRMTRERREYRERQSGQSNPRTVQQINSELSALREELSSFAPPVGEINTDVQSRISAVSAGTRGTTMMGGRSEQEHNRRANPAPPGGLYSIDGRRISNVISSVRHINEANVTKPDNAPALTSAKNECDSNADTCVLGKNFYLLSVSNRTAEVYGFRGNTGQCDDIHIGTGVTAWDDPRTGETILLVMHESLWYGNSMDHSLINPNQIRQNRIPLWDNPYDPGHDLSIDIDVETTIPFRTQGTKIFFESYVPTQEQLNDPDIKRIELTSMKRWNPLQVHLSQVTPTTHRKQHEQRVISVIRTTPLPTLQVKHLDPRSNDADLDSIDPLLSGLRQIQQVTDGDVPRRRTFVSSERHNKVTAAQLAENFCIGIQQAQKTLAATLQHGTRSAILPLERRYRADNRFELRRLSGYFATDTIYFPCTSLRGYTCSQIYYEKCGFSSCHHLTRANGEQIGQSLTSFSRQYGIPSRLTMDGAKAQVERSTNFQSVIRKYDIDYHVGRPYRPNENPAEGGIREIRRRFYRISQKYTVPPRLWCFQLEYVLDIMRVTVTSSKYAEGRTPLEIITGITPDISEYLDFPFYSWVWFRTNAGLGIRTLGRWIGVSHRRGPAMTYWILPVSGIPISCDSVQRVTNAEQHTDDVKNQMDVYTNAISRRLGADFAPVQVDNEVPEERIFDFNNEELEFIQDFNRIIDDPDLPHADLPDHADRGLQPATATPHAGPPAFELEPDNYVDMIIDRRRDPEGPMERARVKRRAIDVDGRPLGTPHESNNPLLDHRMYEVEYADGHVETLAANVLAENILAQVDDLGRRYLMIDEIIGHRRLNDAIPTEKGTYTTRSGATRKVHTTRGWELYILWKDGSANWISLKDVKDSYPIELAEYARDKDLLDEPAFAWWARYTLKKRTSVLAKVKTKYWERATKYGIKIPKSVAEAKRFDEENGNTLWQDAIKSEMSAIIAAFEEHEGDPKSLIGFQEITGHLVFDVKLGENFRRKARYCADGHKTETPASMTYSSVVSRDSVRIMLMIAALNGLQLRAADVKNAFLTAPNLEKVYIYAGDEFGPNKGKCYIVRRALYGLKSASSAFRRYLTEKLDELGFRSSIADPDVWLRPAVKPDGSRYYTYVLAYVDDILAVDVDAEKVMREIGERFKFKNDDVSEPTNYLGARIRKRRLDGVDMWTISPDDYTKAALKNIDAQLKGTSWTIPSKSKTPMSSGYHPELDDSEELNDKDVTLYQELIGMIRWATEIGRVDVLFEVSVLSQHQALPRAGHLRELLRIISYWKYHEKISLYMDPRLPNINYDKFVTNHEDFRVHYRDAKEPLPHDAPRQLGNAVWITAFVDASHAANKKTRRSHTGFVIFVNRAPIFWYSKRQSTVEASTFSSEFIALKTCIEYITHLRYKLRMFGIPLGGDDTKGTTDAAHVFCDNETVVKNSSLIESTLNKKHSSIAYHYVRWNVAAMVASMAWVMSEENLSDPFTKGLNEYKRDHLFSQWTY